MAMSMENQIKVGMRKYLAESGKPMKFDEPHWEGGPPVVSRYGWGDYNAQDHILKDKCRWVVPEGVVVKEETYIQFDGTFTGDKNEVGLNAAGCRCECGKYTDVTLRVTDSLGNAIQAILGFDPTKQMEL